MYEDTYLGTADGAVTFVTEVGLANVGISPTSATWCACTARSSTGWR